MLPEPLLACSVRDAEVLPFYLDAADHPWLAELLALREACVELRQRELDARLKAPLEVAAPERKLRMAVAVLQRLGRARLQAAVRPAEARAALFEAAAGRDAPRDTLVAEAAARLEVRPDQLEESLFADLPGERRVPPLPEPLSPGELALRTNLALARGIVYRAASLRVALHGNARAVVRQARLAGLICAVRPAPGDDAGAIIEVSGPYALFRRTLVYGRALGGLLPLLSWCRRFHLSAACTVRGQAGTFVLRSGDPIFPSKEPRRFDSRLEELFARDLQRHTAEWALVREPEPIRAGDRLIFPDFGLQHRHRPGSRWLVEIVGFWTPGYLERKLADLRAAGLRRLVLCVDATRSCAEGDLPTGALVIRYRRRIDPAEVLAAIESAEARQR